MEPQPDSGEVRVKVGERPDQQLHWHHDVNHKGDFCLKSGLQAVYASA